MDYIHVDVIKKKIHKGYFYFTLAHYYIQFSLKQVLDRERKSSANSHKKNTDTQTDLRREIRIHFASRAREEY